MSKKQVFRLALLVLFALLVSISARTSTSVMAQGPYDKFIYLPIAERMEAGIIVDHTSTDITQIPEQWIIAAREIIVHYAHTSHGSQIVTGLNWLETTRGSLYNVDVEESGTPHIPDDDTALRIYDGTLNDTYVEPGDYWETEGGRNLTRSVVGTGWFDFSQWSWCGQVSYYSDPQIEQYLQVMSDFEVEFPNTRFILMTGHTELGSAEPTNRHNDMIRAYARANNMILFDFADIEQYYPDGSPVPDNLVDDSCPWCEGWCDSHPGDCANFDLMGGCAHADASSDSKLLCSLKGQAYWYLMARLAGWNP